jgi:putative membrane protein
MTVLWRIVVNAVALWAATQLVDGIRFTGAWPTLLLVALVFGVVNVTVRPVLKLLTFPLLILTLGLFTFVLNALMLWLTSTLSDAFGLGFHDAGFRAAFWGALVVTAVSFVLSLFVRRSDRPSRRARKQG